LNINTDSRTMTNITLNQEYENLHRTFGWDKEQFLQSNLHALKAAFISEPVKQQLIDRLLEAYHTL
jgi:adenosine deaminase